MTANSTPIFVLTPKCWAGSASAANTARDGSGSLTTLVSAGANGSKIEKIELQATVTTAAGSATLFIFDGTTTRLWREVLVSAVTVSTTVAGWNGLVDLAGLPLVIPSGWSIKFGTTIAQNINAHAFGGDY